MFIDSQAQYSKGQDLGQAAGTYPSTNVLDHGAADADAGLGRKQFIHFAITEAFASAGAATLNVQLATANEEDFSDEEIVLQTGAIALADIPAALAKPITYPLGLKRYSRLNYVIGTAAMTAGGVTASVVKDVQRSRAFPTAIL